VRRRGHRAAGTGSVLLIKAGASSIDWRFLTQLPKPVGEVGAGWPMRLAGTLTLLGLASLIGVPVACSEACTCPNTAASGRTGGFGLARRAQRCAVDCLGIVAYALVVVPMKGFSAYAAVSRWAS